MKKSDLVLSLGQRLLLLFFLFLVCYILTMACSFLLGKILAGRMSAMLRIGAVIQDVLAFVVPAAATAMLVTRRPAELLCVKSVRQPFMFVLIACMMVVSLPLQEAIIWWNYHLSLPESMASLEHLARSMEELAANTMATLMGETSWAALIVNILIIGVLAGFSEELLFRGCFQRLLTTAGVNRHLAIWLVAFCFSALHFQLFGFVPRMLLGAYFGYLLWWGGSIWLPISAHVLNNTVYVITAWIAARNGDTAAISAEPELWSPLATILSAAGVAALLVAMHRLRTKMLADS